LHAFESPVFPVLGTMDIEHLAELLDTVRISLTPEQREWLRTDHSESMN